MLSNPHPRPLTRVGSEVHIGLAKESVRIGASFDAPLFGDTREPLPLSNPLLEVPTVRYDLKNEYRGMQKWLGRPTPFPAWPN